MFLWRRKIGLLGRISAVLGRAGIAAGFNNFFAQVVFGQVSGRLAHVIFDFCLKLPLVWRPAVLLVIIGVLGMRFLGLVMPTLPAVRAVPLAAVKVNFCRRVSRAELRRFLSVFV